MNGAIGDVLPVAIGVAISPVPIIAVILLLLAPRAKAASAAFAVGWVAGIVVTVVVVTVLASTVGLGASDGQPSTAGSWVKIGLGVLLLLLAAQQWRSRPAHREDAQLPGWMASMDRLTPAKALGLGLLLSVANPKNLLLGASAGVAVGGAGLSTSQAAVTIAIYSVLAASTVLLPAVGYAVASDRLQAPLDDLKTWLVENNATVMSVLLLVLGVATVGKGIGGLH